MRHLGELNIVQSSQSAFIKYATSYHVTSALRFVCSCDTRVWRSFVYHALCVVPARVALTLRQTDRLVLFGVLCKESTLTTIPNR